VKTGKKYRNDRVPF